MAVVQRVLDTATGRTIALKRLRTSLANAEAKHEQVVELFEREYLTLAQLVHPRIVEAYDYGIDDEGPYYTMELLDGGDLHGMAPVHWQKACGFARDVCSALALLHSRRMVYRDLSPRNVRCTADGRAKLIDFGAMTPMGVSRGLVGTLPFVPPEALHQQALDARTDLYALGATLYFTLLSRHAYPARDVGQLRDFWRSRPRRPSEIVAIIPEALDRLIMELIQLDPAARPASAAEVMERLAAISGARASEHLSVTQAYLSNPTLVGRSAQLAVARKLTLRALHGRGVSVLIDGQPGLGRTRFLAACVLEAKLAGTLVLHADAVLADRAPFDMVRSLATQLLHAVRPLALEAAEQNLGLLGRIIPELVAERPEVVLDTTADTEQLHRRAQPALRQWLLDIAGRRPLLIAVDDLPDCDEASVAFVSLLAQEVSEHSVMIAATASRDHKLTYVRGALDLFASASTTLELEPLTLEHTIELLSSVFGDVPNLDAVALGVQGITAGNPRDIMRVAQHLVSEGAISYSAGTWRLPARLSGSELPASMADALRARVEKLSVAARTISLGLALEPGQRFAFDECATLLTGSNATALRALDELVEAEVLLAVGQRYTLGQQGWGVALASATTAQQTELVHLRLAEVFERRGEGFRSARHLLAGGELERGLDALLVDAEISEQRTDGNASSFFELLAALPKDWLATYELGLRCCADQGRPAADVDRLLSRLSGLVAYAVAQTDGYQHIQRRLDLLKVYCGLDLFAAQPATLDFATRIKASLEGAAVRYQQTPAHERVLEPGPAMRQIAKTVLAALGTIAFSHDHDAWKKIPSLAPLAPLSPALALVELLSQGLGARISARSELAIRTYEATLERLARPDRSGLEVSHHFTSLMRVKLSLGNLAATMGLASSLARADEVALEPSYTTEALHIRHIYYVWQGDTAEAARVKRSIEVLQVETSGHRGFEGQHLFSELCAYGLSDDMTRVKRVTDVIEARAVVHHAWRPAFLYGCGEHHRIRGDHAAALAQFTHALELAKPGGHQIWPNIAGAHLRTLFELGRYAEVKELGTEYLARAEECALGYVKNYLRMPLGMALAKLGEQAAGVALSQLAIDELLALGSTGINLAAAYEARARIDLIGGEQASSEHHAALSAEQWRSGRKRLSVARQSMFAERRDPDGPLDEISIVSQFTSTLEGCNDATQRARCGLEYLGRNSGARGGLLYVQTEDGLARAAIFGDVEASPDLDSWASAYFSRELDEEGETTDVHSDAPDESATDHTFSGNRRYVPVLLTHQGPRGVALTGVALLLTDEESAFTYPSRVAAELSRTLGNAGDAVTAYV